MALSMIWLNAGVKLNSNLIKLQPYNLCKYIVYCMFIVCNKCILIFTIVSNSLWCLYSCLTNYHSLLPN